MMLCAFGTLGALVFFFALLAFVVDDPLFRKASETDPLENETGDQPHKANHHSSGIPIVETPIPPANSQKAYTTKQQPGRLEYVTFGVGILTLGILGIYTQINYWLLQTTQRQLEMSERPWIRPDIFLAGPLTFDKNGMHVILSVGVKNIGHSVALKVWPTVSVVALQIGSEAEIRNAEKRWGCPARSEGPAWGTTIFPDQLVPANIYDTMMTPEQIEAGKIKWAKPGSKVLSPYVLACIEYRAVFSDADYQTAYIYRLQVQNPQYPWATEPITIGEDVPLNKLRLVGDLAGIGNYAY